MLMECMAIECSSDAVEGELFCHVHAFMTAEVDPMECPRGCGLMAYNKIVGTGYGGFSEP